MKRVFLCLAAGIFVVHSMAAAKTDSIRQLDLNDVVVIASYAGENTPVTHQNLSKAEIRTPNVVSTLPQVLWMTPSLVHTAENGTSTGNTAMRIRGTDASRINFSLNGIPMNNPESQEVYWVNIPNLTGSLQSIQIQRGVGVLANGTGAFGASVNLLSERPAADNYIESSTTAGSYGTFEQSVSLATSRLPGGVQMQLRYTALNADGYLRNGWSRHQSLYGTLGKSWEKAQLSMNYIYGNQHTGITWEGASKEQIALNPAYNPAGAIKDGLYYGNESDNYRQHHIQLFYSRELTETLLLNTGLNYTDGYGYYEQYKQNRKFSSLGLSNQLIDGIEYDRSDHIRGKFMANGFYTGLFNLNYQPGAFRLQGGGMYSFYQGVHYARLLWLEHNGNIPANYEWVRNFGEKTDGNLFIKAEYALRNKLFLYADLQYRNVRYELEGIDDDDLLDLSQLHKWQFWNPKMGVNWRIDQSRKLYLSAGIANREPTRADLKDAVKGGSRRVLPERLYDVELGYSVNKPKWMLALNLYDMEYHNQLIPTGKLNEVGYKLMSNVPYSYRRGMELSADIRPFSVLQLDANLSLSTNKVKDFSLYYSTYDNASDWNEILDQSRQISSYYSMADLPFSPACIAAARLQYQPVTSLQLSLMGKYIAEQQFSYIQHEEFRLPAYTQFNFSAVYSGCLVGNSDFELGFYINNLLGNQPLCNAWGYEIAFLSGEEPYRETGYYVLAPRHYMLKFVFKI